MAEKLAPNHQVAVYTHADTDHVHNHIVINSINLETGKKFNNNKQALRNLRNFNDEVCREHGLSVPEKTQHAYVTPKRKKRLPILIRNQQPNIHGKMRLERR